MALHCSNDFGQLYRKALAERDPVTKNLLLQEVQAILDAWGQCDAGIAQPLRLVSDSSASGETARSPRSSSSRIPLSRAS